jgi:competence protein ComEA
MPKTFLNSYFGFNKQQRNGLFVLICMSLVLLMIRLVYPIFIKPGRIVLLNLPVLEKKLDSNYSVRTTFPKKQFKNQTNALTPFIFDPNTVTAEQLRQLRLKEKVIQTFLKFRNNGFVFSNKKDLLKVYGISEQTYGQLEPYIFIEAKKQPKINSTSEKIAETKPLKQTLTKVDLNTADSSRLVAINGIGATYAKRILKYRDLLGGFFNVEQLQEVYGFNKELFEKVKDNFYIDKTHIKKINLNKDDFKLVNKHPYITYELTKLIFDWRKKTNLTAENLKDIINDPELYQKLLPYLSFE